jgi:hypothetical protein
MPHSHQGIRKHLPNDRSIVLPGNSRQDLHELPEQSRTATPPAVELASIARYELRTCPNCGRETVRYNSTTGHFNSHKTPEGKPCYKVATSNGTT